jgi:hypothetical protein
MCSYQHQIKQNPKGVALAVESCKEMRSGVSLPIWRSSSSVLLPWKNLNKKKKALQNKI